MIERRWEAMRSLRRYLHRNPDPSGRETPTTRFLEVRLKKEGLSPRIAPSQRGLWVDVVAPPAVGEGSPSDNALSSDNSPEVDGEPKIGIRADIDGLWIADEKQNDYRSEVEGVMHACGHDAHSAVVFGAITALAEMQREGRLPWPIACRAIFQPAEETNAGALEMIEGGALRGLTDLLGVHVDPSRAVGTIGIRHGDFTADCHEVQIEIRGRGAHAARPHEAIDPIAIGAQLISSIYLFVPRGTDSQDPVVITFGQIHGGHTSNAIPDQVVIRGTLRTLDREISRLSMQHIERLARGLAEASGAKIEVRWLSGPPPVKNDPGLVNLLVEAGRGVLGEGQVQRIRRPSMGGEDFANYLRFARGAMFRLGSAADPLTAPPLHSPLFDIDERALRIGAEVLSHAVIRWCDPKDRAATVARP